MNSYPPQNLRMAWVGFHQEGIPALRSLLESGIRVEALITLTESAMSKRCAGADYVEVVKPFGVPVHGVGNINDPASVRLLQDLDLDLLFVIGWSQILQAEALKTARLGVIGAHASLLPHNRGSAPVNWTLIRGESSAGNTLIWLSEGIDEGGIVDQMAFPVTLYDTCESLYRKVADTNRIMIERLLPRLFAGERPCRPQPHADEAILPRRKPADGRVEWHQPAPQIYDFVRALTRPYPGAFSFLDGRRWTIQACALLPQIVSSTSQSGTVVGSSRSPVAEACGQVVVCHPGAIVLLELEDSGGRILKGFELSDRNWEGKVWSNE